MGTILARPQGERGIQIATCNSMIVVRFTFGSADPSWKSATVWKQRQRSATQRPFDTFRDQNTKTGMCQGPDDLPGPSESD